MNPQKRFSTLIQDYFYKNLINQRHVSDKTVKSYRDTFLLLFRFSEKHIKKRASELSLSDITPELIVAFLNYLERERKNTAQSRNVRLAAIHSFLHYVETQTPEELPTIQRVLAIPMKHHEHVMTRFLTHQEMDAIINSTNLQNWSGQRDQVLFATLYNTGARVSEITFVKRKDIEMGRSAVILLHGKGRKERAVPLWKNTTALIRKWLAKIDSDLETPLFPNHFGKQMTSSGVQNRLSMAVKRSCKTCESLKNKKVSPHVIRHTTAMHLLQSGVDITVISLWLGHENINTTHKYMEADLEMKKRILMKVQGPKYKVQRKPISSSLLTFLDGL